MADIQYLADSASGGFLINNRLSMDLREALVPICKFRQFVDTKEAFGLHKGQTVLFNKVSSISTAGGTLVETDVMPAHKFVMSQGTITLSEWGNSIPWTGKLEALSFFDVNDPVQRTLRDDMASVLDKACGLEFKKTGRKYTGTSTVAGTLESIADGDTLGSGKNVKGGWRLFHIEEVVAELKRRKIPKYDGENYVCIASVNFLRQLMKDSDWKNDVRYGDPERLFSGEVGRCRGVRFIEETNYLINTIGSGGNYGEAVVFGAESVIEGVAIPEELRQKIPTDYGRSKGLAWYGIMGWEKCWKHTDAGNDVHIIHMTGKS